MNSDFFASQSIWNLIVNKKIINEVEKFLALRFPQILVKIQELNNQKKEFHRKTLTMD